MEDGHIPGKVTRPMNVQKLIIPFTKPYAINMAEIILFMNQAFTYVTGKGSLWWQENQPEIEKAVQAASKADIIIACIGENSYCETPGNLTDLNLSGNQKNIIFG